MWLSILNTISSKKDNNDSGSKPTPPETQIFIGLETGLNSSVILAEDGTKLLTEVQ